MVQVLEYILYRYNVREDDFGVTQDVGQRLNVEAPAGVAEFREAGERERR